MILFYLLVGVMPLARHALWSETKIAGLTLNKYLGIACFLLALAYLAARHNPPTFFRTVQSRIFVIFGLITVLSFEVFGPSTIALELSPVANWVSFLLLFFTSMVLIDSHGKFRLTLLSLIGGVAFASLHLIREWVGWGGPAGARPGWVTGDPNYFALSALLCLPVGFLMAQARRPAIERIFCWACFLTTLIAFTLAGSRGGFLGLIVSFVAIAWNSRYRVRFLTIGAFALGTLVLTAPTSPLARLLEPSRADVESTDIRAALLWAGLNMFEQNVWTGIGVGNFKTLVGAYALGDQKLEYVAHNTYLEVAAEQGVLGAVAFVTILLASILTLGRVRRQTIRSGAAPLLHTAARGLEAGLLGSLVTIFFLSALHVRIMWFVVILSMCLPTLVDMTVRRKERRPVESRRVKVQTP